VQNVFFIKKLRYFWCMDTIYKVSDGSAMSESDFYAYVYWLKKNNPFFDFDDSFCEDDFWDIETFKKLSDNIKS
jgi:hypothetical protein